MYCPNCGEELRDENQRFCSRCGSKISSSKEIVELESEPKKETMPIVQQSKQISSEILVSPQKTPVKGAVGPYSKKSLADGIISIGITVVALYCSFIVFMVARTLTPYLPLFSWNPVTRRTIILTILAVIYLVGLILANAARSNSKKARSYELENGIQKAGNVLGIIGTIINSIAIAVILITLFTSILNYVLILF
ncbi:MAG: zinc-ribbon domain-containing protein [Candidatus Thorarchaeota archaeon]